MTRPALAIAAFALLLMLIPFSQANASDANTQYKLARAAELQGAVYRARRDAIDRMMKALYQTRIGDLDDAHDYNKYAHQYYNEANAVWEEYATLCEELQAMPVVSVPYIGQLKNKDLYVSYACNFYNEGYLPEIGTNTY